MTIATLRLGQRARILEVSAPAELEVKLREVGFYEGDYVELMACGPLGGQPLAVRLNRRVIAMRLEEAACIIVESIDG
jgi:Fe2+ transport system protein FeoA